MPWKKKTGKSPGARSQDLTKLRVNRGSWSPGSRGEAEPATGPKGYGATRTANRSWERQIGMNLGALHRLKVLEGLALVKIRNSQLTEI